MKKKEYQAPKSHTCSVHAISLLTGSTETLVFDPNDSTNEALSDEAGENALWDDEEY